MKAIRKIVLALVVPFMLFGAVGCSPKSPYELSDMDNAAAGMDASAVLR